MQPPQIVILITTISMSILVTIAWLVGSSRQKDEIPFEDTVRWYGRPTQEPARLRRNTVGRSLGWIIQGAFLMPVGLAFIMPMTINADMEDLKRISHIRS